MALVEEKDSSGSRKIVWMEPRDSDYNKINCSVLSSLEQDKLSFTDVLKFTKQKLKENIDFVKKYLKTITEKCSLRRLVTISKSLIKISGKKYSVSKISDINQHHPA